MSLWEFISSKMSRNLKQTVGEKGAVLTYEELIVFAENFAKKLKMKNVVLSTANPKSLLRWHY